MDDMLFYILSNRISVISRGWKVDNKRLCAMELRFRLRFGLEWESNSVKNLEGKQCRSRYAISSRSMLFAYSVISKFSF